MFILGGAHGLCPLLGEKQAHVSCLGVVHPLIVYLGQGVELLAQYFHFLPLGRVFQGGQGIEIHELRMKGENANGTIGIGVCPCMGGGGIVDGEHLQDFLSRHGHEVYHLAQVPEVAHAKAPLAAQGEDGHQGTCQLAVPFIEPGLSQLIDVGLPYPHVGHLDDPVVAHFPLGRVIHLAVTYDKLELHGLVLEVVGVEVYGPLVVLMLGHVLCLQGFPVAQLVSRTQYGQPLSLFQLGGTHFEPQRAGVVSGGQWLGMLPVDAVCESRCIEVSVGGRVHPLVISHIVVGFLGTDIYGVEQGLPLLTIALGTSRHAVVILQLAGSLGYVHVGIPLGAVGRGHLVSFHMVSVKDIDHQGLAKDGSVIYIETEFHKK